MKHILKFATEKDYQTAKRHQFILPNVSIIEETKDIHINGGFTTKTKAEAGDVVAFNSQGDIAFIKPQYYHKVQDTWSAEAIVVVPYDYSNDGFVRCVSTRYMNLVGDGDIPTGLVFNDAANIETLRSENKMPNSTLFSGVISVDVTEPIEATVTTTMHAFLPSDKWWVDPNSGIILPGRTDLISTDPYTYWSTEALEDNAFAPSPYHDDRYFITSYQPSVGPVVSLSNVLSDFNGKSNTDRFMPFVDEEYLTSDSIPNAIYIMDNETRKMVYAPVLACARYSTPHIPSGSWYLPSAGELGFGVVRQGQMRYAPFVNGPTLLSSSLSSQISQTGADSEIFARVDFSNGCVYAVSTKQISACVVAFTKI